MATDISYWMIVIGGILAASDIFGPHIDKLERVIERLARFEFLSLKKDRFQSIVPVEEADLTGNLGIVLLSVGVMLILNAFKRRTPQGEWYVYDTLFQITMSFCGAVVAVVVGIVAIIVSALLVAFYIVLLILELLYRVLKLPFSVSMWIRERYKLPYAVRLLGLAMFVLGSALYYLVTF